MTDNPAIEAMARAIMIARPNGGCIVSDWQKEAVDNPHVSTALAQARAALTAYHEHLAAAGSVVISVEWLEGVLAYANPIGVMGDHVFAEIRAMIAAAKGKG